MTEKEFAVFKKWLGDWPVELEETAKSLDSWVEKIKALVDEFRVNVDLDDEINEIHANRMRDLIESVEFEWADKEHTTLLVGFVYGKMADWFDATPRRLLVLRDLPDPFDDSTPEWGLNWKELKSRSDIAKAKE